MAASSGTANNDKFSVVLGAGGYGIVLYPALTDTGSNGKISMKHPFMATKLFYTKEDYDDAFRKYHALRTKIPHIIYEMKPYRRSFSTRNFENNTEFMKEYKRAFFGDKPLPPHPMPLYAAAIPYLGSDLDRIMSDPSRIARFIRIPEKDIIREVYYIFYKIKQICDAGLMHGDIKLNNVVFNFNTNKFNLIDTDSITTWKDFITYEEDYKGKKYIGAFYPPEYYMVINGVEHFETAYKDLDKFESKLKVLQEKFSRGNKEAKRDINWQLESFQKRLQVYTSGYFKQIDEDDTQTLFTILPQSVKHKLAYGWIHIRLAEELYHLWQDGPRIGANTTQEKFDLIEEICKNGFDSYSLSLTLFRFFNSIRHYGKSRKYEYLTNTILARGIDRHFYSQRSNLDTILLELKHLARDDYGITLYPPLPRSQSKSKTRSRSGSTGSKGSRRSSRGS
jgi:hypothetical protein